MSGYLMKYKGTYRLLPEIDQATNDFVRDENGEINDNDTYIACRNGIKVYAFGHEPDNKVTYWLTAYVPSLQKGRKTVRELQERNIDIRRVIETDSEVMFNFKAKDIDKIMEKLKPVTLGKNISPHSTKNLPKTNYEIPKESIEEYKEIIGAIPKNDLILIKRITDEFLSKIVQRFLRKTDKTITVASDMRRKCMSRAKKEYIHSLGLWDRYVEYLKKEI